jgi:DNA-binding GntR family transcriptional regulator
LLKDKVRAHSLVDAVTERLEAAIVDGTLQPGSKLSEQALAQSLGVSRGPLREAIRRLEGRKLLQRTANIGVRVVALSPKDIAEILQMQIVLQGLACALAAQNMSDVEIAALAKTLDRYRHRPGKGDDYDTWDLDFHSRIFKGSGNERLEQTLHEDVNYLLRVHRSTAPTTRGRALQVLKEHRIIVKALVSRDPVAAERAMRRHVSLAHIVSDTAKAVGMVETAEPGTSALRRRKSGQRGSARTTAVRQL